MTGLCPPLDAIHDFAVGKLSAEKLEDVATHIDYCDTCRQHLESISSSSDSLVQALQQQASLEGFVDESACQDVVQQLVEQSITGFGEARPVAKPKAEPVTEQGIRFGQYLLIRQIGRGGMGSVYQALHLHLERIVAIKVLSADRMKDQDAVSRFEREMRAVGRLEHPHIVRAMDAGEHDGVHFLVMEYVHGPDISTVASLIKQLKVADACEIARQAALGLDYAFRRGLVHRDIKPSNLMISLGQAGDHTDPNNPAVVRVLDFGLALLEDDRGVAVAGLISHAMDNELTGAGQLMGTLDYIAPEQIGDSHDVDVRADIYSLGATLFKLLTGNAPFAGGEPIKRLDAIRTQDAPLVASAREGLPSGLAKVVQRMLARDPSVRFQTPMEVAKALVPYSVGADLRALAQSVWEPQKAITKMTAPPSALARRAMETGNTEAQGFPEGQFVAPSEPTTDRMQRAETRTNLGISATGKSADSPTIDFPFAKPQPKTRFWLKVGLLLLVPLLCAIAFALLKPDDSATSSLTQRSMPNTQVAIEAPEPLIVPFDAAKARAQQEAWAKSLEVPPEFENSIGMKFRVIPPGTFRMGLTEDESNELKEPLNSGWGHELWLSSSTQHEVTLTQPFAIGVYEVTADQFARFVDASGHESMVHGKVSHDWRQLRDEDSPDGTALGFVTWHDGVAFADWLSRREKVTYSLPTEAEWEFACRAGAVGPWPGDRKLDEIAWAGLSNTLPKPVGGKAPNPFGLFDMLGNVAEWCQDNFQTTVTADPTIDPTGPPFSDNRVHRGYGLNESVLFLRSGMRAGLTPMSARRDLGFRLVRRFDDSPQMRRETIRPVQEVVTRPEPLGDNAVEVGAFGMIEVPTLKLSTTGPATLEVFATPRWTEVRGTRHLMGVGQQNSLFITPDGKESGWSLGLNRTTRFQGLMSPVRLVAGQRTHVAGVRTGQRAFLFVNGKLVHSEPEVSIPLSDSDQIFAIGTFEAIIDEARVSSVARYEKDFAPETRLEPDNDTLALWHFDEGTGFIAHDASANGHHARLKGAKWLRPMSESPLTVKELAQRSLQSGQPIYLDDLTEREFDCYPILGKHGVDHTNTQITWRGLSPTHAVMLHPNGEKGGFVVYDIEGAFATFEATVAITDNPGFQPDSPLTFRVLGDGNVLWTSMPQVKKGDGEEFSVSARGVKTLRLEVQCAGRNFGAHSFWMEPRLFASSKTSPSETKSDGVMKPTVAAMPSPAVFPFSASEAQRYQAEWAKHLGIPVEFTNSLGMKFRLIPPGELLMGIDLATMQELVKAHPSLNNKPLRYELEAAMPRHRVRITKPFYMGVDEVQIGTYRDIMGRAPLEQFDDPPEAPLLSQVTWYDAIDFCNRLSTLENKGLAYEVNGDRVKLSPRTTGYRLPTEAEWEFACRAGTDTFWFFGNDPHGPAGNFRNLEKYERHYAGEQTLPNPFGLFDLYGGANEWCFDRIDQRRVAYSGDSVTAVDDPVSDQTAHGVKRGSAFWSNGGTDLNNVNSFAREVGMELTDGKYSGFGRLVLPISSAPAVGSTPLVADKKSALHFDGNARVEMSVSPFRPTTVGTLEAWLINEDRQSTHGFVVETANGKLQQHGTELWFYTFHGEAKAPLPRGPRRRLHMAGVNDGKQRRLYLNGKLAHTTADAGIVPPAEFINSVKFQLGNQFRGTIDAVKVSKTARYSSDFTPPHVFEADADTVALYLFDEGQGEVLNDSSANGYHGKIIGARWVQVVTQSGNRTSMSRSSAPAPASNAPMKTIDLLSLVDLEQDLADGHWELGSGGFIAHGNGVNHRMNFPVETSGRYSVRAVFTLPRGNFSIVLPIGEGYAELGVLGTTVRMKMRDAWEWKNATHGDAVQMLDRVLFDDQPHELVVDVVPQANQKVHISGTVDGLKAFVWTGDTSRIAFPPNLMSHADHALSVNVFLIVNGATRLLKAELTAPTDQIRLRRP